MRHDPSNSNIRRSLDLAHDLIMLASQGEADSRDDGCITLYGIVRDCGYRIRRQAESEKAAHESKGRWLD